MPSRVFSGALHGLEGQLLEVEVEVSHGLRSFSIVGLPDKAVKESEQRIDSAIKSSKLVSPHSRTFKVLVNLAPADIKKEGSLYDLPIALAFLLASGQTNFNPTGKIFIGELSLEGKIRPIKGALIFALLAQKRGFQEIILPKENSEEAALVKGIKVIGVSSLSEALGYLERKIQIEEIKVNLQKFLNAPQNQIDIGWIKGQEFAKRALEITAAGGHNLFMVGPPGGGKSLLAKALPSILPPLDFEESLEVTKIYSVAGFLKEDCPFIISRPFRAPHHSSSESALIGGGNPPKPGEITLAHRGVLFLDEFPEFHKDVLESLRQPLEDGKILLSRAKYSFVFPARFMLIAAANPCPCGFLNSPERVCTCSASQISMYRRKMSGPLMDRMDLLIEMPAVKYEKLISDSLENQSEKIREKVKEAREIQRKRFEKEGILTNSEMNLSQIKKYCQYDEKSKELLKKFVDSGKLSARGYHKVLKVARTIADLDNSPEIKYQHVAEALMYRIRED